MPVFLPPFAGKDGFPAHLFFLCQRDILHLSGCNRMDITFKVDWRGGLLAMGCYSKGDLHGDSTHQYGEDGYISPHPMLFIPGTKLESNTPTRESGHCRFSFDCGQPQGSTHSKRANSYWDNSRSVHHLA